MECTCTHPVSTFQISAVQQSDQSLCCQSHEIPSKGPKPSQSAHAGILTGDERMHVWKLAGLRQIFLLYPSNQSKGSHTHKYHASPVTSDRHNLLQARPQSNQAKPSAMIYQHLYLLTRKWVFCRNSKCGARQVSHTNRSYYNPPLYTGSQACSPESGCESDPDKSALFHGSHTAAVVAELCLQPAIMRPGVAPPWARQLSMLKTAFRT